MDTPNDPVPPEMDHKEKPSTLGVIVHSFFIVPFLIAVFAVLIFAGVWILTREPSTAYDYLNDIKVGSSHKRWQAAFELSKHLAHPKTRPQEERFVHEMISAFEYAEHDDARVQQYLALAMGRTGNLAYAPTLIKALDESSEENLPVVTYALGLLKAQEALPSLISLCAHPDERVRLTAVMSLGNIGDPSAIPVLKQALHDSEVNVQWDAAIALAKLGDPSGKDVLQLLLDSEYLERFPEVDAYERNAAVIITIQAAVLLNDPELNEQIQKMSEHSENMSIRKAALSAVQRGSDG